MTSDRVVVIETGRLAARLATADDADLIYALWTDPRVMSNVGFPKGLRVTRDEIQKDIEKRGLSALEQLLIVELKETGAAIGQCKMNPPDETGIAGTDVKLLPAHWGHQYGVEIKRGLVEYLFAHTDCQAVEATPNVNNLASIKMQEAVGGVRLSENVHHFPESMRDYTTPVHYYVYRVYRDAWERQVEQMMLEHFGEEYQAYMKRTGRAAPRVGK